MDESGICHLCWQPCDLTKYREHVPPKGCFPKGTQDLITVCCCESCNHGNTQYDELFRMITTLTPTQSVSQRKVWQRVMDRTLSRGRLKKEIEAMRATLSPVIVGGMQFGKISVASRPFRKMMIRITKGFLRHYTPQVDYRAFEWQVLMVNQFRAMKIAQTMAEQDVFNYHERGEGSHRLLYGIAVDAPASGLWLHIFHDGLAFSVMHRSRIHSNRINSARHLEREPRKPVRYRFQRKRRVRQQAGALASFLPNRIPDPN